ncbi:hypothetical protein GCM10018962_83920 [Dactylosporangium matsuzakiense]|uniref:NhaP-type Na+/H+ or K+/H+ antiporter n=2 Tax=Dactylosporangium matsuzakiense TaxID=53360 RepID=A0A9W6NIS2_9ACTN|nr:hypothetical protein GCM10017581_002090 [Dactylosporangium matsuzakiense]
MLARLPVTLVTAVALGWGLSLAVDTSGFLASRPYQFAAAALLAIGLIATTRDIVFAELRGRIGTVVLAVTVGVLVKAAVIVLVLLLVQPLPLACVLGIAVAQIDPLAVAAMQRNRLSRRARSILSAWASFDDPITVLLTIYATAVALSLDGQHRPSAFGTGGQRLGDFAVDLLCNAVFAGVAWLLWRGVRRLRGGSADPGGPQPARWRAFAAAVLGWLLLAAVVVVGAALLLILGVAVAGLFVRPDAGRALAHASTGAFHVAAFGLGILLVEGVDVWTGLVLAVAAVVAHAAVSVVIGRGLDRADRAYLAAGQQNGMTAVILALLLDRDFPGVVAVVAPAIVVITAIHFGLNAALDRRFGLLVRPATGAAPTERRMPVAEIRRLRALERAQLAQR